MIKDDITTNEKVLVTVSTCPRPEGVSYLSETLASLDRQGALHLPKIVMSNGEIGECGWPVQINREPRSTRTNLWASFKAAVDGGYDRLLYFEDDVLVCRNGVHRMARVSISERVGLMTFHDMKEKDETTLHGIYEEPVLGQKKRGFWGLQAVALPRRAFTYLASRDPFSICKHNVARHGDETVGQFLSRSPWPLLAIHMPCLVQHVGSVSVAHPKERLRPGRVATNWPGIEFDALTLPA